MSDPFLSEIRMFSFQFAPRGWAMCNGATLPIGQNRALFSVLGTTFGGDGVDTFALPDLRARVPLHLGSGLPLGARGGEAAHRLTTFEMPAHVHVAQGSSLQANSVSPWGALMAVRPTQAYRAPANLVPLNADSVAMEGGGQPHPNMQPYLTLNFCIALEGMFPSRN
jgi:microcystin-dependent protein